MSHDRRKAASKRVQTAQAGTLQRPRDPSWNNRHDCRKLRLMDRIARPAQGSIMLSKPLITADAGGDRARIAPLAPPSPITPSPNVDTRRITSVGTARNDIRLKRDT